MAQQGRRRDDPLVGNELRRRVEARDIRFLPERVAGADDDRVHLSDGTPVEAHSVPWCTGVREDHAWVDRAGAAGQEGRALHVWAASRVPGRRWTTLPWQHRRKPGIVDRDARMAVDRTRGALAGSGTGVAA